jgi:hypothetical protein
VRLFVCCASRRYRPSFLNRLRFSLRHFFVLNHVGAVVMCVGAIMSKHGSHARFNCESPGMILTYALAILGYFYNVSGLFPWFPRADRRSPQHCWPQVSYFLTFDAKRQPSKLIDWVKVCSYDVLLNWVVLCTDVAMNLVLLVATPFTLVMMLGTVVAPTARLPSAWMESVYRLSGFNL